MNLASGEKPFDRQMLFDHPDPYPLFAMLRAGQPVFRSEFMTRVAWVVTRYDDCLRILKDPDTFSSRGNAEVGKVMGRTLIEMDGKEHTRHRGIVQQLFVPKGMSALEPVLRTLIDELLAKIEREPTADLVTQFTECFPIQVIMHMVGVPRVDYPTFQRWALDIIGFAKDLEPGLRASADIREYLLPIIAARRAEPRDDVISTLVSGRVEGNGLTDEEIVSSLRLLLPAGAETTMRLIGSLLVALLSDREERWERVRADRGQVGWAIEETLRWETPVLMVSRETTRAAELHGQEIPPGDLVTAVIGSANRDERHYPDPDVWQLDRHADDHLSFGFGRHHCLGYHLARLEARLALEAMLDRLPGLRLDPDAPPPQIQGLAFRSPKTLRVRTR
jgi:cytochrome P450